MVVWQGLQQGATVINAQRISPAGALLWQGSNSVEVLVSNGGLRAAAPHIALDSNGVSSIVWCDERRNNLDIFMQSLDTTGQRRWPADVAITQPDRFYQKGGLAESHTVDSVEGPIRQATLTADFALQGGTVDFAITNDGATWQSVALGTRIVFTTTGSDLRWRAQLQTNPHDPATSPIIRAVQIDYDTAPPLAENDRYESDDGCGLAQALQTDGAAQQHELMAQPSAPRDEDWLRLTLHGGQKYILWAAPAGRADALQLELYNTCGAAAAATVQSFAGQSTSLQWTATTTSTHFIRVRAPDNVAVAAPRNAPQRYQIGIRAVNPAGSAILVAGRLSAAASADQALIDQTVDRVYQKLQQQGYAPTQINYLGHATGVTRQALQTAIQGWAVTQQNMTPAGEVRPLLLYLAGRGSVDRFYLNETESITPALLNLWLSNLEAHAPIQPITVILEAGQAGSFITTNQVISDTETLAAPNRIVVAATNALGRVWHTSQGLLFSDIFWSTLASGQPVQQSFQRARQGVYEAGYLCQNVDVWCQEPWLDDTGLGLPTRDLTGGLAAGQGLAGPAQGQGPQIQSVIAAWNEATQTLSIEAQLVVSNTATQVEAQLISAQQPPILGENAPFPVHQPPSIRLTKVAESPLSPMLQLQIYRGTYPIPAASGSFWVSVHAWDSAGVFALPFGLQFQNGFHLYLPIVER